VTHSFVMRCDGWMGDGRVIASIMGDGGHCAQLRAASWEVLSRKSGAAASYGGSAPILPEMSRLPKGESCCISISIKKKSSVDSLP
jgi:hypothetical protein